MCTIAEWLPRRRSRSSDTGMSECMGKIEGIRTDRKISKLLKLKVLRAASVTPRRLNRQIVSWEKGPTGTL